MRNPNYLCQARDKLWLHFLALCVCIYMYLCFSLRGCMMFKHFMAVRTPCHLYDQGSYYCSAKTHCQSANSLVQCRCVHKSSCLHFPFRLSRSVLYNASRQIPKWFSYLQVVRAKSFNSVLVCIVLIVTEMLLRTDTESVSFHRLSFICCLMASLIQLFPEGSDPDVVQVAITPTHCDFIWPISFSITIIDCCRFQSVREYQIPLFFKKDLEVGNHVVKAKQNGKQLGV